MNHRDFLRSLTAEQKRTLTERSDQHGLQHLALHLSLLAANTALIFILPLLLPVLLITQGVILVFLFTLLHETTHNTPFKSVALNRLCSWFCGFIIFLPAEWFRHFHLAHHRYTHQPGNDPELASAKPATTGQYIMYLSGLPVWKSHLTTLLANASGRCDDSFVPAARMGTIKYEARLMLAGYAVVFSLFALLSIKSLFALWILPLILGQPFLRAYLLAEHGHCEHVDDMFRNTRTTLTHRIVYFLAWNMPYHAEHHAYPSVPFHRLPQLHQMTRKYLGECENGYYKFNREFVAENRANVQSRNSGPP